MCARAHVERRRGRTSPPSSSGSLVRPHRYVFVVPRDGPSASAQRARASGSARGPASRSTCFAAPASMPRASDRERAAHGAMETTRGRWDSGSDGARARGRDAASQGGLGGFGRVGGVGVCARATRQNVGTSFATKGLPFRWCRISVNCVLLLTRVRAWCGGGLNGHGLLCAAKRVRHWRAGVGGGDGGSAGAVRCLAHSR